MRASAGRQLETERERTTEGSCLLVMIFFFRFSYSSDFFLRSRKPFHVFSQFQVSSSHSLRPISANKEQSIEWGGLAGLAKVQSSTALFQSATDDAVK